MKEVELFNVDEHLFGKKLIFLMDYIRSINMGNLGRHKFSLFLFSSSSIIYSNFLNGEYYETY